MSVCVICRYKISYSLYAHKYNTHGDDNALTAAFAKYRDADNAMECITNEMSSTGRNEKSLKLRMARLGLQLPDEYRWSFEVWDEEFIEKTQGLDMVVYAGMERCYRSIQKTDVKFIVGFPPPPSLSLFFAIDQDDQILREAYERHKVLLGTPPNYFVDRFYKYENVHPLNMVCCSLLDG